LGDHVEHLFYAYVDLLRLFTDKRLPWRLFLQILKEYAYFFFYSWVRSSYIKRLTSKLPPGSKLPPLSTAAELLLGAVAGALAQIFTIPVSVIATRQQVGRPEKSNISGYDTVTDDSFMAVAHEIIAEEGVTGLWLGLKPGLVLTVNPAITYGVFERVKSLVLMAKGDVTTKMSPWLSFIVGALSKTLATIVSTVFLHDCAVKLWFWFQVTYPYIMAKVRIQARTADAEVALEQGKPAPHPHEFHHKQGKHVGALQILSRVWKREGFIGWYQVSCSLIHSISQMNY
jgi:hypothetical protein